MNKMEEKYQLTEGEENLMYSLYENLVIDERTPGWFREMFMIGAISNKWSGDDAVGLEKKSLAKIHYGLIQAGIMCLELTDSGKQYMEDVLTA